MGNVMVDDEHYKLFDDRCYMGVVINCSTGACILGDFNKVHRLCDNNQYGNQGAEKRAFGKREQRIKTVSRYMQFLINDRTLI